MNKYPFHSLSLGLLSCMTLMGCPDEELSHGSKKEPQADMEQDASQGMDMPVDMPMPEEDMADMMPIDMFIDMPDASCMPLAACPQDACGQVSDGCGGMLECTPCACVNGEPSVPTCGVCDLGSTRCEGEQVVCDEPTIDVAGLNNCRANVIYVDASFQGVSTGSKEEPFNSLGRALTELGDDSQVRVYALRRGTYNETPLVLPNGTHVIGGYGRDWAYDASSSSTLRMQGSDEPTSRGILIEKNERALTLENLEIQLLTTPDGREYVTPLEITLSQGVQLVRVHTTSINGVLGAAGENGVPGQDGLNGGDGALMRAPEQATFGGQAANASGRCLDSNGGDGGQGGSLNNTFPAMNGGEPAQGGRMGGQAGTIVSRAGEDGGEGTSLASMTLMSPALPTGNLMWIPPFNGNVPAKYSYDGDGGDGVDGAHGGGGTGGGGGYAFTNSQNRDFAGGGGGAGGSGGCGGTGGQGGQAGGSSFGLVILDSPDTLLKESSFQAQAGGNGGTPGRGGEGGQGGLGGKGTFSQDNPGGDGGDGGQGQDGVDGAPGAGGFSVGIICNRTLQAPLESVTAQSSVPGAGASTLDGADRAPHGQAHDIFGCEP